VISASLAAFLGWLGVAFGNAVAIAALPWGRSGVATRLVHLSFDLGHTLALGLVVLLLVAGWDRFGSSRRIVSVLALAAVSSAVFVVVLVPDLRGAVERWTDSTEVDALVVLAAILLALAVPAAVVAGRIVAHRLRFGRALGSAVALGLIVANHFLLVSGYPGAHLWIATVAATLLGASLAGRELGPRWAKRRTWSRPLLAAGTAAALASLLVPAPSRVELELLQRDTAFLAPVLDSLHDGEALAGTRVPPRLRPWFESRARAAERPPHPHRLLGDGGIVVLVTVDALRFDVFSRKYQRALPNLNAMREAAVFFSQARSFGSDTRFSLGALFTGRYIAMTRWTGLYGNRPTLEEDELPRLPELLAARKIDTATALVTPKIFARRIGIVRGFAEHVIIDDGGRDEGTPEIIDHLIARLRRQGPGSLFYYTHLMDPHLPYNKHGKRTSSAHDAYMQEVAHVDRHIGRLRAAIRELGLAHRTLLILSADHGEAFGEHGQRAHNRPLYDVQVHVPLLVECPGVKPATVDSFVSTLDVGPTVLDALRVPTPGYWMAESLVPLLIGETVDEYRPIFMERVLTRALLFPNGLKVMLRNKDRNAEIYNVREDPEELDDLRETLGSEGDELHALARQYALAHARRPKPPRRRAVFRRPSVRARAPRRGMEWRDGRVTTALDGAPGGARTR
jgi:arylsulfatase A-like enzyme